MFTTPKGVCVHNRIPYGRLDEKGYALKCVGGQQVVAAKCGGRVAFDVDLRRNVLVVCGCVEKRQEHASEVIMAALTEAAARLTDELGDVQRGTLMEIHRRLGNLSYDAIERLPRDPNTGIVLTAHRRVNCLTCAEGKPTKNRQSPRDSGNTHQLIG
ncbi:hypothetical protein PC129_g921 [Phytophthora cactorum]|uniref:Uncharacterized protein n=1 Tax=Phytophthora cactorum TaxID=29920 RepID=A0A329SW82_9STRA|nr:hypothetical protein Pcac1_g26090 [Phytophthora cactorum]KAG2843712.1 hypothetical protein PC112_g2491 [Phytophthora cactorum]KAG2844300.1 hypothetical protein PC111_g2011 [Phytophthora cactorum]KAG2866807.1 hypothetical protein PC113_g2458 [Phytophthora cactorum]KAG2927885.1 hypothetical protein PC114_g3307 [Phytophthora cactorum]